ncbi:MAG: OmpA family protein [Kiritimatiellaeota bacterium]|nr:OmpA family protein [Kiritimatiellota bacterium]
MSKNTLLCVFLAIIIAASSGCRNRPPRQQSPENYGNGNETMRPPTEFDDDDDTPLPPGDFTRDLARLTDEETGEFTPVYFSYDAHNIPAPELSKIRHAADFLAKNPTLVVVVEGHCDERGTTEYNIILGENRALNIRNQLISYGVSPARIQTVSFGKEKPADPRHTQAAWNKNRRAEFAFYRARN